jgi:hypothetical protein
MLKQRAGAGADSPKLVMPIIRPSNRRICTSSRHMKPRYSDARAHLISNTACL